MNSTVRTLSQSDVFGSLDEPDLVRLAAACGERTFGPREIVFLRGDPGTCVYVVAAGAVEVAMASEDGRDVLLAILGPGRTFGELAVVDDGPRVATVTARERTVLVTVPGAAVRELLTGHPSVTMALFVSVAAVVRSLDERARDASLLDLPRRVEKYLRAAAHEQGPAAEGGTFVPVDIPLTQSDIAREVGGSRQQVNRVLMRLEASGSIRRSGHRIVAIRPEHLYCDE